MKCCTGTTGRWIIFDGERWNEDVDGEVVRRAKAAIKDLLRVAATLPDEEAKSIAAWVKKSLNEPKIAAMLRLARADLPCRQKFDADPMLLGVSNGVVDLRSGVLRKARWDDYISKRAGAVYDQTATCPVWHEFLRVIFAADYELIGYVQDAIGYSLTGDTSEQCWFLMHGGGANGKSTLQDVVTLLLGDYARQAGVETFLERRGDRGSTSDLARLEGARLVSAAEPDENRELASGVVKQLTGGDRITARFQYGNEFEYRPQFKLWFATNHLPRIRDTSNGMWRRVRYIPFNVQIREERQDRDLIQKLKAELPGILRWAIEGVMRWREFGLQAPAAVQGATNAYRGDQDLLRTFIEDCCDESEQFCETSKALFAAYERFAGEQCISKRDRMNQQQFGRRLDERGLQARKGAKGVRFRDGIRIRSDPGGEGGVI